MKKNVVTKVLAGCMALALAVTGVAVAPTTAKADGYHAYIGFQTPSYSFRDAYSNTSTGYGTACFDVICSRGDTSGDATVPGTLNDTDIDGDGTYTVSATDIEFEDGEFDSQDYMNLIFVSTDIPYSEDVSFSDVSLKVNGNDVSLSTWAIPDDADYIELDIQNIWDSDDGIDTIAYYQTPVTSLEITFTISGVGAAASSDDTAVADDADTTADTTTDTTTDSSTDTTKTADMIPVAGVVVAFLGCGVVAFAVRKKVSR